MKLTFVLLTAAFLNVRASGYSQTVSYTGKTVPLERIFSEVEKQTGYFFMYPENSLSATKNVSVDARNMPLLQFLELIFRNQPLSYSIASKTVILAPLVKARPVLTDTLSANSGLDQMSPIRGRVMDETGAPLSGASVTIKNSKNSEVTDADGRFSMNVSLGDVLIITYIGYKREEIKITASVISSGNLFIGISKSTSPLDEVQVQAYGTTSKRFSVGSIASVDAETIARQPVSNVLLALQGQAPGLAVNATGGVPGSRVLVQIRGQNTILTSPNESRPYDQPLFIIDGVPFAPQNNYISQLSSLSIAGSYNGGISQPGGVSPFNNINPADIESVSVLKDADATSIYGTQGSNGVIIITTKKGKPGKSSFNLTLNTGFNTSIQRVKLLNTSQYLQFRKDAFAADGTTPSDDPNDYLSYAPDVTIFDQNKYTDWQKTIFGKTSNNTDIHASLSGGTPDNTFIISTGYTRSDFNYPGNSADERLSLHASLHHSSLNKRLTVDFGTDFGYDQNNSSSFGGAQKAFLSPNTPDLIDASGNLVWNYKGVDLTNAQFYASLKMPTRLQNYNLNNSFRVAYKMFAGLSISANLGYSRTAVSEHSENPGVAQNPSYSYVTADFASNTYQTIIAEPQIDYTKTFGKGMLTALIGGTYKKNVGNSSVVTGSGYSNDNFLGSINGAASIYSYDNSSLYRYSAGFARMKYVYDQKYIVSLTGRRDGSSNFGPGHQFGNFGSVGLGWIFSEEKGFQKMLPFISYAKLSGSYGTSGSDGVAPYKYQAFWQPLDGSTSIQGTRPSAPVNLYNPDYSWALKKSLNLSMDLGFFKDRLLINATFYRSREGNQLTSTPLPAHVGFRSVLGNLTATVQNQGWEFSLNSTNIKTRDLTWSTSFNISANRNKLVAFPNLEVSSFRSIYAVGQSTSQVLGYRFKGLNTTTGLYEYYTQDGKTTINPTYGLPSEGGDYVTIGNREVKFMGGMGNTLSYKRLSLSVFFQFSKQMAPSWLNTFYGSVILNRLNVPVEALDFWKKPGDQTTLQKLTTSYNTEAFTAAGNFISSSGAYVDDTYLRLKTVSLSWSLPEGLINRLHMQDCRIYVNAQNLLTFTNYKVADPELFNYDAFPLQRIVAFGLSLNF